MNDFRASDWQAIDAIENLIDKYRSGDLTDYKVLKEISNILRDFEITDRLKCTTTK